MMARLGSVFTGCGALDLGLCDAGFQCEWQIEIDPACRRVLERHFPGHLVGGDVREVDPDGLSAVDLIAGGSPCQDLSVAGLRAGLDGERSGLFHELVRIADSQPAAWVLWENVRGALSSSNGEDFATVLRELSGFPPTVPVDGWRSAGVCVGPKRWAVWRVLDSQHFGVPQRRQRVFVIAGPGGTCRPEVLFESCCLPGDPSPSRAGGASVAGLLAGCSKGGGWRVGADEAAGGALVIGALSPGSGGGAGHGYRQGDLGSVVVTAPATSRAVQTRGGARMDPDKETYIVSHALRGEGADPSEDGSWRGTPLIPTPYHLAQVTSGQNRANPQPGDPAPALNGDPRMVIALQEVTSPREKRQNGIGIAASGEPMFTLQAGHQHAVAYQTNPGGVSPAGALRNQRSAGGGVPFGVLGRGVRRLTPRECERLQGLPDDWSRWDAEGRELSDSSRYRMIGNAVTVPVLAWIGRRLAPFLRASAT